MDPFWITMIGPELCDTTGKAKQRGEGRFGPLGLAETGCRHRPTHTVHRSELNATSASYATVLPVAAAGPQYSWAPPNKTPSGARTMAKWMRRMRRLRITGPPR